MTAEAQVVTAQEEAVATALDEAVERPMMEPPRRTVVMNSKIRRS
jgi:hypothetical protein